MTDSEYTGTLETLGVQSPPSNPVLPVDNPPRMSRTWTVAERHCLHIMATHYPESVGADRTAIFNHVFNTNLEWKRLRDEYGGHKAGQRNRPNGQKPTRSIMWNDHVCRDEFGLGFDQQQTTDRADMLQQIQGAINTLGLAGNYGLGAINSLPGMTRADTAVAAPATAPPPTAQQPAAFASSAGNSAGANAPPTAAASSSSSGPAANTRAAAASSSTGTASTDPATGGRSWYHSREIVRERGEFVYRPNQRLDYNMPQPSQTWHRQVRFPDGVSRQVQVCDVASCPSVCGRRIRGG